MSELRNLERNMLEATSPIREGNVLVPPAVIINLEKDQDRYVDLIEHLSAWNIHHIKLHAVENISLPATSMSTAEISCSLSHAAAIRYMMLTSNKQYMNCKAWLIIEDDCRFLFNPRLAVMWALLNAPSDWSVISLGSYNKERPKLEHDSYKLYNKINWIPYGAHAYLVNPSHAARLLSIFSCCIMPVDTMLYEEFKSGRGFLIRPSVAYQEIYQSNVASWGIRNSAKKHADLFEEDLKLLLEEKKENNLELLPKDEDDQSQ